MSGMRLVCPAGRRGEEGGRALAFQTEIRSVDVVFYRGQRVFALGWFQLAFPDCQHAPSHSEKLLFLAGVAGFVSLNLRAPEVSVGLRQMKMPFVSVPEASMDEDDDSVFPHHDVGGAGKTLLVFPVAVAALPQPTAHNHLRAGVFSPDSAHAFRPLLFGHLVGHSRSGVRV